MGSPLTGYALGTAIGIFAGYRFSDGLALALTAPFLLLLLIRLYRSGRKFLFAALLAFAAGQIVALHDLNLRETELELMESQPGRIVIDATIDPEIVMHRRKGDGALYEIDLSEVSVPELGFDIERLPVKLRWYGAKPGSPAQIAAPRPGERWQLTCTVRRSTRAGVLPAATVTSSCESSRRLDGPSRATWRSRCERARQKAAKTIEQGAGKWKTEPNLLKAFLLGYRAEIPDSIRQDFTASGTVHVFAISGLHIMFVASIFIVVLSALGVSKKRWILLLAPALILYTVAVGARPSAIRACAMAIIYIAAPAFGRKPDAVSALSLTAAVAFTLDPSMVYDIGCQLSFATMIGLIALTRPFMRILNRRFGIDRISDTQLQLKASGRGFAALITGWAFRLAGYSIGIFAVSLAAWIASIPLSAIYFDRLTPSGLLVNLVISPCALLVAVSGASGLAASAFSEFVASCFINSACFFTSVMMHTASAAAAIPGGSIDISEHHLTVLAIWLAAVALLAGLLLSQKKRLAAAVDDKEQ